MADLPGWPWWKVISITGQSGAGTDYQVKLEIGDSAGGNFHLEGHCTNFPQDIRITDDDGTTLLDHFVEDLTADPIIVQVKVNDDLGSNQDIRVYYGKSGETTASDIKNTMLDGDDFPGSSLDTSIWDSQYCNTAVSGGKLTISAFSGGGRYAGGIKGKIAISPSSHIIEGKIKQLATAGHTMLGISELWDLAATCDHENIGFFYNDTMYGWNKNDASQTLINKTGLTVIQEYKYKIANNGSNIAYTYDGTAITGSPSSTNLPNENMYMRISGDNLHTVSTEIDWIFVRKYHDPEPAFSSAGAEQSAAGAPTGVFYGPLVGPFGGPI